jgi:hypothetical protein
VIPFILAASLLTAGPPKGDRDAALKVFEQGRSAFADQRYDAAAEHFKDAYDRYSDPAYLFNIAVSYQRKPRWRLAVRYFERFLAEAPDSPARSDVANQLQAAREALDATLGTVVLRSVPAGVAARVVHVGGDEECVTPCEVRVDPGTVTATLQHSGQERKLAGTVATGTRWTARATFDAVSSAEPSGQTVAGWTTLGVGGALLINSAIFAGLTSAAYADGQQLAGEPTTDDNRRRLADLRGDVDTRGLVADVSLGVGVAAATVGLVLWLTDRPDDERATALLRAAVF